MYDDWEVVEDKNMCLHFEDEATQENVEKRDYVGNENEFSLWGVDYIAQQERGVFCEGCHFAYWLQACKQTPACSEMTRADGRAVVFVPKDPENTFVKGIVLKGKHNLVDNGKINARINCINL